MKLDVRPPLTTGAHPAAGVPPRCTPNTDYDGRSFIGRDIHQQNQPTPLQCVARHGAVLSTRVFTVAAVSRLP